MWYLLSHICSIPADYFSRYAFTTHRGVGIEGIYGRGFGSVYFSGDYLGGSPAGGAPGGFLHIPASTGSVTGARVAGYGAGDAYGGYGGEYGYLRPFVDATGGGVFQSITFTPIDAKPLPMYYSPYNSYMATSPNPSYADRSYDTGPRYSAATGYNSYGGAVYTPSPVYSPTLVYPTRRSLRENQVPENQFINVQDHGQSEDFAPGRGQDQGITVSLFSARPPSPALKNAVPSLRTLDEVAAAASHAPTLPNSADSVVADANAALYSMDEAISPNTTDIAPEPSEHLAGGEVRSTVAGVLDSLIYLITGVSREEADVVQIELAQSDGDGGESLSENSTGDIRSSLTSFEKYGGSDERAMKNPDSESEEDPILQPVAAASAILNTSPDLARKGGINDQIFVRPLSDAPEPSKRADDTVTVVEHISKEALRAPITASEASIALEHALTRPKAQLSSAAEDNTFSTANSSDAYEPSAAGAPTELFSPLKSDAARSDHELLRDPPTTVMRSDATESLLQRSEISVSSSGENMTAHDGTSPALAADAAKKPPDDEPFSLDSPAKIPQLPTHVDDTQLSPSSREISPMFMLIPDVSTNLLYLRHGMADAGIAESQAESQAEGASINEVSAVRTLAPTIAPLDNAPQPHGFSDSAVAIPQMLATMRSPPSPDDPLSHTRRSTQSDHSNSSTLFQDGGHFIDSVLLSPAASGDHSESSLMQTPSSPSLLTAALSGEVPIYTAPLPPPLTAQVSSLNLLGGDGNTATPPAKAENDAKVDENAQVDIAKSESIGQIASKNMGPPPPRQATPTNSSERPTTASAAATEGDASRAARFEDARLGAAVSTTDVAEAAGKRHVIKDKEDASDFISVNVVDGQNELPMLSAGEKPVELDAKEDFSLGNSERSIPSRVLKGFRSVVTVQQAKPSSFSRLHQLQRLSHQKKFQKEQELEQLLAKPDANSSVQSTPPSHQYTGTDVTLPSDYVHSPPPLPTPTATPAFATLSSPSSAAAGPTSLTSLGATSALESMSPPALRGSFSSPSVPPTAPAQSPLTHLRREEALANIATQLRAVDAPIAQDSPQTNHASASIPSLQAPRSLSTAISPSEPQPTALAAKSTAQVTDARHEHVDFPETLEKISSERTMNRAIVYERIPDGVVTINGRPRTVRQASLTRETMDSTPKQDLGDEIRVSPLQTSENLREASKFPGKSPASVPFGGVYASEIKEIHHCARKFEYSEAVEQPLRVVEAALEEEERLRSLPTRGQVYIPRTDCSQTATDAVQPPMMSSNSTLPCISDCPRQYDHVLTHSALRDTEFTLNTTSSPYRESNHRHHDASESAHHPHEPHCDREHLSARRSVDTLSRAAYSSAAVKAAASKTLSSPVSANAYYESYGSTYPPEKAKPVYKAKPQKSVYYSIAYVPQKPAKNPVYKRVKTIPYPRKREYYPGYPQYTYLEPYYQEPLDEYIPTYSKGQSDKTAVKQSYQTPQVAYQQQSQAYQQGKQQLIAYQKPARYQASKSVGSKAPYEVPVYQAPLQQASIQTASQQSSQNPYQVPKQAPAQQTSYQQPVYQVPYEHPVRRQVYAKPTYTNPSYIPRVYAKAAGKDYGSKGYTSSKASKGTGAKGAAAKLNAANYGSAKSPYAVGSQTIAYPAAGAAAPAASAAYPVLSGYGSMGPGADPTFGGSVAAFEIDYALGVSTYKAHYGQPGSGYKGGFGVRAPVMPAYAGTKNLYSSGKNGDGKSKGAYSEEEIPVYKEPN